MKQISSIISSQVNNSNIDFHDLLQNFITAVMALSWSKDDLEIWNGSMLEIRFITKAENISLGPWNNPVWELLMNALQFTSGFCFRLNDTNTKFRIWRQQSWRISNCSKYWVRVLASENCNFHLQISRRRWSWILINKLLSDCFFSYLGLSSAELWYHVKFWLTCCLLRTFTSMIYINLWIRPSYFQDLDVDLI